MDVTLKQYIEALVARDDAWTAREEELRQEQRDAGMILVDVLPGSGWDDMDDAMVVNRDTKEVIYRGKYPEVWNENWYSDDAIGTQAFEEVYYEVPLPAGYPAGLFADDVDIDELREWLESVS